MIYLYSIFVILVLCLWARLGYNIYQLHHQHKRKVKSIDDYDKFHKKLLEWSNLIGDPSIKREYFNFCIESIGVEDMVNFNYDSQIRIVHQKFGKWIPELNQKYRDVQIDKILNDKYERTI